MVDLEEPVGAEWAEWYRLTPVQRWLESEKLWQIYLALGGSLDPEPDTQSPFYDPQALSPRPADTSIQRRDLEESQERERARLDWIPLKTELEQLRKEHMQSKRTKGRAQKESLPKHHKTLFSAIEKRHVLTFLYEGYERIVEPQTYGMSLPVGTFCAPCKQAAQVGPAMQGSQNSLTWRRFRNWKRPATRSKRRYPLTIRRTARWHKCLPRSRSRPKADETHRRLPSH